MSNASGSSSAAASLSDLRNVLGQSKSPYLLQHKDNPVAWQEFNPETLTLAAKLQRPIFLSSGYSACHWCHVLAHESFENPEIAKLMNEYFINIKIDREERPDVDRLYMGYLQATGRGGGWPLSVFMAPTLEPFFAGTYFPPAQFQALLERVANLWETDRGQCERLGKNVIASMQEIGSEGFARMPSSLEAIMGSHPAHKLYTHLRTSHDPAHGGFSQSAQRSSGPKFPSPSLTLEPLARLALWGGKPSETPSSSDKGAELVKEQSRIMGVRMLRAIWEGGVRDWVGGGVARYSVDEKWRVPHFEKMLYDQAQLISSALDFALLSDPTSPGLSATQKIAMADDRKRCFDLAANILEYCLRDLKSAEGGFWTAEDADSAVERGGKKSEGAFYVWSKSEIEEVLGKADAKVFDYFFGVKTDGNVSPVHDAHGELTGMNILYQSHSVVETAKKYTISEGVVRQQIVDGCAKLKKRRDETRERPGLDDKILTSCNGLMLSALAKSSIYLPSTYAVQSECLPAAEGIVQFIKREMWDDEEKRLWRSYREGRGTIGQTDDYAFFIQGLLDMYESTSSPSYLTFALTLQDTQDSLFWDPSPPFGYFASAPDPHVLIRLKDTQDGAEPSSTSVSVHNLARFTLYASDRYEFFEGRAEEVYLSIGEELMKVPRAWGGVVAGLMQFEKGWKEFIITGSEAEAKPFLDLLRQRYIPNKVVLRIDPANPPAELGAVNATVKALLGETQAGLRVCEAGACGMVIADLGEARRAIYGQASARGLEVECSATS